MSNSLYILSVQNKLIILDRFASQPDLDSPFYTGRFGYFQTALNIYAVGLKAKGLLDLAFNEMGLYKTAPETLPKFIMTLNTVATDSAILRAMSVDRATLLPLIQALQKALAQPDILSFDPLERKF